MKTEISIDNELIEQVLKELEDELVERVYSKDLVDGIYIKNVLNHINTNEEREKIKNEIAKAFVMSNWTQRIYFVVRSVLMTIMGALITLAVFWRLGTINVIEDLVLGILPYVISLVLTRLFDTKTTYLIETSKNILAFLGEHCTLRNFIVKNLRLRLKRARRAGVVYMNSLHNRLPAFHIDEDKIVSPYSHAIREFLDIMPARSQYRACSF